MSKNPSAIETAKNVEATKAEGELRKAAGDALKRAGLPEDLIERTKTLPGSPFEHATALAKLPDADRANLRKAFKEFAGFPVGDFDRLTAAGDTSGDGRQGRPVEWNDPEPWPESVDGAALLGEIAGFMRRYVALPAEIADTVTLWTAVTRIHDQLEISPFLNVTSATKRCGKSLLLEVLGEFVYQPLPAGGRVTAAALFRAIESYAPTLLLDEADTFFSEDAELRGVVNGSQRRKAAYLLRCVGDDHEPRQFVTWCPKAIAGIGGLPDTVLDRSIVVRLERRSPNVSLEHWRDRDKAGIETMRRKLTRWTDDNATNIVKGLSEVEFPSGLHDRARDAWDALLAIGNEAGGLWTGPEGRAFAACRYVAAQSAGEETGAGEMLLADLLAIFKADGMPSVLSSTTIVERLHDMEGRPWKEWRRGKPITAHALARRLKPFNIAPRQDRKAGGGANLRGYQRTDLEGVWEAYFPHLGGIQSATSLQPLNSRDIRDSQTATAKSGVALRNGTKPLETRDCSDVALRNPGNGGNGADSAPAQVVLPKQPPGTETAGNAYRRMKRDS